MNFLMIAAATLLISFDGLRPDQVTAANTPNFYHFQQEGASAKQMTPVFPSSTFPNHASLMTGCWPGAHGIISNHFIDAERGRFSKDEDASWLECEPLWALVQKNGKRVAIYSWPLASTPWQGINPTYSIPFEKALGKAGWKKKKINAGGEWEQLLSWLQFPETKRPQLILGYFPAADHAGHLYGPFASQTLQVLKKLDLQFGRFLEHLKNNNLLETTNIVLVSDHGMVLGRGPIFIDEYLKPLKSALGKGGWKETRSANTMIHFYFEDKEKIAQAFSILKKIPNSDVYAAGQFPNSWHYENKRSGDLVLVARSPHYFMSKGENLQKHLKGFHGYDPAAPGVQAFFAARGPAFQKVLLDSVSCVDVAPTVAKILELSFSTGHQGTPLVKILKNP